MNAKNLVTIVAILRLLFGLVLTFAPDFMAILNRVKTTLAWMQVLMALVLASWSSMLFRQETRVVA